jgi:PBP1b-binding outer membrane lipoprotein LpoB
MTKTEFSRMMVLLLFCLVFAGCSGSKEPEQPKVSGKTATEQTTEAIRDYGKRPTNAARGAQQLGEERTRAIDEATKNQ